MITLWLSFGCLSLLSRCLRIFLGCPFQAFTPFHLVVEKFETRDDVQVHCFKHKKCRSFFCEGLSYFLSHWKFVRNLNSYLLGSRMELSIQARVNLNILIIFGKCNKNEYCIWISYNSKINYDSSISAVVFLHAFFYCSITHLPGEKMNVWH